MPQILKISVKRGRAGYGFILSNQAPCVVSNVTEGGPADFAALRTGDEILEVDNQNVSRSTHEQVVRLILKCPGPWITLKIRRFSDSLEMVDSLISIDEEKEDLHKNILETVDKVVEDLKLGNLFKGNEDTEKKRSQIQKRRSKSLRQEKPFEDHVPRLPTELEREEDGLSPQALAFKNDSIVTENIAKEKTSLESPLAKQSNDIFFEETFKAVVGYLRTVELPDSRNLSLTSQNVLNNCIRTLHVTSKKVNKQFLMSISMTGIKLSDSTTQDIVTYPLRSVTYTCSCPEDDKYFGIVTKKDLIMESLTSSPYDPKRFGKAQSADVCSCHIFMVDPDLVSHRKHISITKTFGISCHVPRGGSFCEEFPANSSLILEKISSLFEGISLDNSFSCDMPESSSSHDKIEYNDSADELSFFENLEISEFQKNMKYGGSSMEVRNFTRSPFRARKTIPKDLFDGSGGKDEEDAKRVNESCRSLVNPQLRISPTIDDPLDEEHQKAMPLHISDQECSKNEKKKECDQSLEMLLKDPVGLQSFEDFLKKEHSEENIMFWKAIENFRAIVDPGKLRKSAIDIYHTYLAGGAPGLVNVDQKAVKKAEEKLINPESSMFDLQQQQIFMLMKYDCFPRFLKSEFYRRISLMPQEPDDDSDRQDQRKRKSQWYLKIKSSSKDSAIKGRNENDASEQTDKKKTLLSLWSKGKGPKHDTKSRDKPVKLGKSRARYDSQSSLSDSGSKPTTPNFTDDRKKFELPKSPSEIKELLGSETPFCRVVLPNGSSNVVMLEPGKVIRHILNTCCSRQNLQLSAHDIFAGDLRKSVDLDKDSMSFAGEVFLLERKIQFRFDLPNKRSVAVRDSPSKTLHDVIEPILRKNGYDIEKYIIHLTNNNNQLPLQTGIAAVENKHLVTEDREKIQGNVSWKPPPGSIADIKSSFKRLRQSSKDDSSLLLTSKIDSKPSKSQEDLNKFSRRGSLEGHRSYFSRLKQGIKGNKTTRSKSIDHTNYALKAMKSRSEDDADGKTLKQDVNLHARQNSMPLFDAPYDAGESNDKRDSIIYMQVSETYTNASELSSEKFRPASKVLPVKDEEEEFYDRRASVPLAKNTKVRDSFSDVGRKGNSSSDISPSAVQKHPRSKLVKNMHSVLNAAVSDPELAVRRGRTKNVKALKMGVARRGSDVPNHSNISNANAGQMGDQSGDQRPRSNADLGQYRRLSRNLLSWRARENSCDSVSSLATDETDSTKSRKTKREDVKRYSSPEPVVLKSFPRSPRNKQKKLETDGAEIAIANSPVYFIETNRSDISKGRPQPISIADESDILRGLDLEESNDTIVTPESKSEVNRNILDDSFENVLDLMNRKDEDFEADVVYHSKQENAGPTFDAESLDVSNDGPGQESPSCSGSSTRLDYEYNATVTGSVNDETLIMEDKDTGLDLSGLMDMTNLKRNRKGGKQKGEKEPRIKETAITFV